jgi:cytochrome c oxidase assembly protein subunit 11
MFAFGYVLVPLYDVFCEITGVNGKTVRGDPGMAAKAGADTGRWVDIQFTGTVMQGLPWQFRPVTRSLRVRPGEPATVSFLATNRAAVRVVAQAVPSVTPGRAAKYFVKTECFCFENQPLGPGESREMPLRFVVTAGLPKDVSTITLSYALFNLGEES